MSVWTTQYPIDFTPNGDRTNGAISKHINEVLRLYGLLNLLRTNFSGAGVPDSPEINQLYISPITLEGKVYTTAGDWRSLKAFPLKHDLDLHNAGTMEMLQALVSDKAIVFLTAAPALADSGKILKVNSLGSVVLEAMPADYTPKKHDYSKHIAGSIANLQSLVDNGYLVYLSAQPTAADAAKVIAVDSNGKYILVNPAAQTDALNAPYEKVQVLGTLSADTTISCSDGNIATCTIGAALTFTFNANCLTGFCRTLTLFITNGGAYTVTWPTSVEWPSETAPTLSASGTDIITFITVDGGTTWHGTANGVNYA